MPQQWVFALLGGVMVLLHNAPDSPLGGAWDHRKTAVSAAPLPLPPQAHTVAAGAATPIELSELTAVGPLDG